MRVPGDHFFSNHVAHRRRVESVFTTSDIGVKQNLDHDVAQFFSQTTRIARIDSLKRFVRLFEQVGSKRNVSLLGVPRTPSGVSQQLNSRRQLGKRLSGRFRLIAK